MVNTDRLLGHVTVALTLAFGLIACGSDLDTSIPRPTTPREMELFDMVDGPITRASAIDLVVTRGFADPDAVRVDETLQWDIAFALVEGEPAWLPRGFFDGIEPSAGIRLMQGDFEDIELLPGDAELYELEEPVFLTVGATYGIRSRTDPRISLPCHIYAKVVVDSVFGDPARVNFRVLWNPNCDDTNVRPGTIN
jgi:hypothetical protein